MENIEDLKPFLTPIFCRASMSIALCKFYGDKPSQTRYIDQAGMILKQARKDGVIRFYEGRERSTYYEFVK